MRALGFVSMLIVAILVGVLLIGIVADALALPADLEHFLNTFLGVLLGMFGWQAFGRVRARQRTGGLS